MKAAVYDAFRGPIRIEDVPDPEPPHRGVVVEVAANGICRSDWHGWMGHDPDIVPPHVPGHEIAGTVAAVGTDVSGWAVGDRVVVPFIAGCGRCMSCRSGNQQVCDHQFQPGFHGWGGFAEYVALQEADLTLARLPDAMDFVTAASLGCRFATSWRAVQGQGRVTAGDWVAVHGCGGIGLAAVMIARALGARVIAIDIRDEALTLARDVGAVATVNARTAADIAGAIRDLSDGGVHVSIDALGDPDIFTTSIQCLRRRGRHVQVGLMTEGPAVLPMGRVIGHELEILGSHGMQAHEYGRMLGTALAGFVDPGRLVTRTVSLEEGVDILTEMGSYDLLGVAVIDRF